MTRSFFSNNFSGFFFLLTALTLISTHAFSDVKTLIANWGPMAKMSSSSTSTDVLVVGSVNADIVVKIPRLPLPGETLAGGGGDVLPGGKGANQAVAASKIGLPGVRVRFAGCFGSDVHAPMLRRTMEEAGVDLALSFESSGPTGQAMILLQDGGENSIVLIPAANADWPQNWAEKLLPEITTASCVLLQREIPEAINIAVAKTAKATGIPVLLDMGGEDAPISKQLLQNVDYLCPNETELQRIAQMPTTNDAEVSAAAKHVQTKFGVPHILVTVGKDGSMLFSKDTVEPLRQPAFTAKEVVDTTGAGDCFRGTFAASLATAVNAESLDAKAVALRLGSAASAHCVGVLGAMIAMPSKAQADAAAM